MRRGDAPGLGWEKVRSLFLSLRQKALKILTDGKDPLMGFRASPDIRASIARWAEVQPDQPSLSEAIRRLVELGLKVEK